MFKACLISALAFYASSAQDIQNLISQVTAAAAPLANEVSVNGLQDAVSLAIGEYDWVLSENGEGEVELNVNKLPGSANNVAETLAALLSNVGASAQENSDLVNNVVNSEAQSLGIALQDSGLGAEAAQQYGEQLQDNAESAAPVLAEVYNEVAAQLNTNENGIADQVNQEINNAIATENVDASDVQNVANLAYNNLPEATANNLNSLAESAGSEAAEVALGLAANSNVDVSEVAEAVNNNAADASQVTDAANSASAAATEAVNSLPSGLAEAASNAATNAASNLGDVSASIPNLRGPLL